MEEKDFQRIEQMIGKAVKEEVGSVKEEIRNVKAEVGSVKEEIQNVKAEVGSVKEEITLIRSEMVSFKDEIKDEFRLQTGILSEDFQHKLQLVAEGNQMLSEKMDRMHGELSEKINTVSADLIAHRADTEGHKRGYQISEP